MTKDFLMRVKKDNDCCFQDKMIKIIFFISTAFIISSCMEKEISIPENILKQKEMSSLLTDIHIAQSAINNKIVIDSVNYTFNDYLNYILKQHKIKKKDFLSSLKFYSEHPDILQEVYDSVLISISRMEAATEK